MIEIRGNGLDIKMGFWCMKHDTWISKDFNDELSHPELDLHLVSCFECRFASWNIIEDGNIFKHSQYPELLKIRQPKPGEELSCAVCGGKIERVRKLEPKIIDDDWIKFYDTPRKGQDLREHHAALYNVYGDCFLGYCGCEEQYRYD